MKPLVSLSLAAISFASMLDKADENCPYNTHSRLLLNKLIRNAGCAWVPIFGDKKRKITSARNLLHPGDGPGGCTYQRRRGVRGKVSTGPRLA